MRSCACSLLAEQLPKKLHTLTAHAHVHTHNKSTVRPYYIGLLDIRVLLLICPLTYIHCIQSALKNWLQYEWANNRPLFSATPAASLPAQRSAQELPQVEKSSLSSCLVSGGEEMVITGSNFFPESKVIFLEKGPGKSCLHSSLESPLQKQLVPITCVKNRISWLSDRLS